MLAPYNVSRPSRADPGAADLDGAGGVNVEVPGPVEAGGCGAYLDRAATDVAGGAAGPIGARTGR